MRRRLTTSVICMREWDSFGWTSTAKMETWEVSMSSRMSGGHGGERARREGFEDEGVPLAADAIELAARDAATCRQASSVMRVTFSVGLDAQAGGYGVACAGSDCGGKGSGAEVWSCLCCLINHLDAAFRWSFSLRIACYYPITEF